MTNIRGNDPLQPKPLETIVVPTQNEPVPSPTPPTPEGGQSTDPQSKPVPRP